MPRQYQWPLAMLGGSVGSLHADPPDKDAMICFAMLLLGITERLEAQVEELHGINESIGRIQGDGLYVHIPKGD